MNQFQQEQDLNKNKFTGPPNGQENVRPPPRPMRPPPPRPQGISQQEGNVDLINARPPMSPQTQPSQIIMQNGNNPMRPHSTNTQSQFKPPIPDNIPQNPPGQIMRPPMPPFSRPPPPSSMDSSVNQNQTETIKPNFPVSNIQHSARPPLESTVSGPPLNRPPFIFIQGSSNQRPPMPTLRPPMPPNLNTQRPPMQNLNTQRPPISIMSIPNSVLQSPIHDAPGSSVIKPPVSVSNEPLIKPPFSTLTQSRPNTYKTTTHVKSIIGCSFETNFT